MPHRFQVTLRNETSGTAERLDGEFSDEDWDSLSRFLALSYRLAKCQIARTKNQLHFRINGSAEQEVVFEATLPPEDDIAAFLLRMRPFVLQREATNFFKVRNILARYLTLPILRKHLDNLRDRYNGKFIPFSVGVNTMELSSEKTVDIWLNAFEYHQDVEKQAELNAMYKVFPESSARVMFLYYMLERASAIGKLGALIDGFVKNDAEPHRLRP